MEIKEFNDLQFKEVDFWLESENDINECIYVWKNKDNNKKYVGQAKSLKRRIREHLRDKHNDYFHNSLRKNGKDNFMIAIIYNDLTFEEKNEYEKFYIEYYDCFVKNGKGYNIAEGGHNGNVLLGMTEEQINNFKNKVSENSKKQWQNADEETRNKWLQRFKEMSWSKSKGYYIVDILENKEIFYEHTLIAEESLDINSGNITYNCQHHRDNNNFKLLHKRYLCFYKDNYTSFEDIMSKYKEQEQKEILIKQRMVLLDTLNKVLRKKEVKQRLEDARVISIDEYGNILEYNNAHQIVCELNTHVGAVYNPLNEQIEAYINDTFYYFIKKQNYKDNYDYVSDLKNKRIDYECEQEEKKLKVVAIDSNYNKEYLKISSDNDKYLKIKEKCENTFNRNHNYANNVVDNVFYVYQKDERLITKEMINRDFNIYNKLNSNNRNTRVFVFDQITKQSQIYDGINKCAKDINGSRSSIGQICNESDSCTHRYKQGRYLIYFLQQWELIPYEKQQQIIKLGRHIK